MARKTERPDDEVPPGRRIRRFAQTLLATLVLLAPSTTPAGEIDTALQGLGLPPLQRTAAAGASEDKAADVHSVLLDRFGQARETIARCQAFLGTHFENIAVDRILKRIPQKPGQQDAVTEETFDRIKRAAGGASGLSRHDLDICVRAVDIPIGGSKDYVRTLAQIDRSLYKCTKVLRVGVPSRAAIDVLASLARTPGSATYTEAGTLGALDRAFGRPTGLTRLDLETCAGVYDLDADLLAPRQLGIGPVGACAPGQAYCQGTVPGYVCCGGSEPICAQTCDEDGDCEPYCMPSITCFPGNATVVMEDGSRKPMTEVQVGDRVQVAQADGRVGFEDVYLLTHKDAATTQTYIRLTLDSSRSLVLSPRHFIPVANGAAPHWAERVIVGANEVQVGSRVWYLADDGTMQADQIVAATAEAATGAFNPLTMHGTIIVDGVVASAHSDWFLDGYLPADAQAAIYQAMMAPVRGIYTVIGPEWTRTVSEDWGVVDAAREGTSGLGRLAAWTGGGLLVAACVVPLFIRRRRALAR